MNKKETGFISMILTLFLVTFIASGALALVYNFTKEPIQAAILARKMAAISEVVPDFNNNPSDEVKIVYFDNDSITLYTAKLNDQIVGTAIESFSDNGFSGKIKIMVGILPTGKISNVSVIEHKETPGLGDKIEKNKSDFSDQFSGKNPINNQLKIIKDGGEINAITAATISSRAFCEAVQKAVDTYKNITFENDSIKN